MNPARLQHTTADVYAASCCGSIILCREPRLVPRQRPLDISQAMLVGRFWRSSVGQRHFDCSSYFGGWLESMDPKDKPYLTRFWPFFAGGCSVGRCVFGLGRYCSVEREVEYRVSILHLLMWISGARCAAKRSDAACLLPVSWYFLFVVSLGLRRFNQSRA